jgi:hypothetical protein
MENSEDFKKLIDDLNGCFSIEPVYFDKTKAEELIKAYFEPKCDVELLCNQLTRALVPGPETSKNFKENRDRIYDRLHVFLGVYRRSFLSAMDFWKGIYPEGMTANDVAKELHDFHFMIENALVPFCDGLLEGNLPRGDDRK